MFVYSLHFRIDNIFKTLSMLFVLVSTSVSANCDKALSPDVEFKNISSEIISLMNLRQEKIKNDTNYAAEVIENILLPKIDTVRASRIVLGQYWSKLSVAEKKKFAKIFRVFLTRQSSSAIAIVLGDRNSKLNENTIKLDDYVKTSNDLGIIKSRVYTNETYVVVYKIRCVKIKWKVYDVVIDGVSFLKQYAREFESQLKNKGINDLIKLMKNMNNRLSPVAH